MFFDVFYSPLFLWLYVCYFVGYNSSWFSFRFSFLNLFNFIRKYKLCVIISHLIPVILPLTQLQEKRFQDILGTSAMFKNLVLFFLYMFTALNFRHRASCSLGQAFHYSPENAFYIFNQQYISLSDICLTVHH